MYGVLVDSEEYICKAAMEMFKEKGLNVKESDFIPFIGAGENRYLGGVAEKYNIKLNLDKDKARTYEIYDRITKSRLEPLPGVIPFINTCKSKGFKLAVATSADEIKMKINLREIGIPAGTFNATINGIQIERKKPYPDIYLKAAGVMGVKPYECLVVEDAPNGLQAGKAAGAKCLGLTTSFSKEELYLADWIAPDLSDVPEEAINW